MLRSLLYAELQYHCRVVEKLSPLFELLSEVNESEGQNNYPPTSGVSH